MQIGILGLLGIVFIALKLADIIAWSWWLVLLPVYGPLLLGLVLLVVYVALVARNGGLR